MNAPTSTARWFRTLLCCAAAWLASCKQESDQAGAQQTSTGAQETAGQSGGSASKPVTMPKVKMQAIVDSIVALPEITKASIEELLHVSLTHVSDEPADQLSYDAPLSDGPFEAVTLKLPNAQQNRFLYLGLIVRAGIDLSQDDFRDLYGKPGARPVVSSPSADARSSLELPDPNGYTIIYSFLLSTGRLTSVHVNLKPPAS